MAPCAPLLLPCCVPCSTLAAPPSAPPHDDVAARSAERIQRLMTLVETRRLYRNCIRAKCLLELPSPVYRPPPAPEAQAEAPALGAAEGAAGSNAAATPT